MKCRDHLLYLAATAALTVSVAAQDLLTVLREDPNTVAFANLLDQYPDMLAALDASKQYTVFAPSNDAVAAFLGSSTSNGTLTSRGLSRRSLSDIEAAIALHFTDSAGQELLNLKPTDLVTNLTDPAFVNLGPSVPVSNSVVSSTSSSQPPSSSTVSTNTVLQTLSLAPSTTSSSPLISSSSSSVLTSAPSTSSSAQSTSASAQSILSPPPSTILPREHTSSSAPPNSGANMPACDTPWPTPTGFPSRRKRSLPRRSPIQARQLYQPNITIYSGFGNKAQSSKCETKYSSGVVRTVDSFFTLFGDLPTTLQQKSGTAFANSLQKAGLLDSWSGSPKVTIFVPTDSVLQNRTLDADTLKQYILFDTLATTTGLSTASSFNSSAGVSVNITANSDGTFIVNNAYIVGANVMIKNGVVHFINNVFAPTPATVVVSAAAVAKIPILHTTAIALAILISYMSVASF
ncbi:FAS1 domain-containing protein [Acephala macrosclerotiorum]|nr:FAS1 domain-containing protein [Acephala macrosclerotiorum]